MRRVSSLVLQLNALITQYVMYLHANQDSSLAFPLSHLTPPTESVTSTDKTFTFKG